MRDHVSVPVLSPSRTTTTEDIHTDTPRHAAMQAALNQLGYKCWHSTTCFGKINECKRWIAAQDARFLHKGPLFTPSDWEDMFVGYDAISADPPAFGFIEDLASAFPDAKVILVERDEEEWYKSFEATVASNLWRWDLHAVSDIDPELFGPVRDMQWHWVRSWWRCSSKDEMLGKARAMYREHNRAVRAFVPAERLLVFSPKDGWAPLCDFLGKEVPSVPFPRVNDRSQVADRNYMIWMRGLQLVGQRALKIAVPALACAAAWWLFRSKN